MHPVDIVLIDLDGTISDSSPGMLTGFRKVFDRFDMEQPSDESIRRHFGPPLAVTWREVYGMTDEQIVVGLEVYREYYHDVGMFENNLYDGIPELIKDLHGEGVTLSTATSKPEFSASRIIEHFGLREYFTFIGAADLAGTRDDKSAVIAHTLENLQASSQTHSIVMMGDRRHDVEGAREHGIDTIGVLWGYGTAEELSTAGAIALAERPRGAGDMLLNR
ncbi:MAG: HAD hydrolase-like protein [Candidatus Nanopelagicales bacterium]|nr:HAD hydrolase-like protein [Candidatus Nanopelagicales bacterium]